VDSGPEIRVIFVAGVLVVGCASVDDTSTTTRERSATLDALRSDELPRRGAVLGGERVRRVAQWPSDDAIDETVVAMMPSASRAAIDVLTLPALVSSRREFADNTEVVPGPRWYATSSRSGGLTVTLNASGEARVYSHVKPFAGNERVRERHRLRPGA
jgi:hypothetical protein